MRVLAVDPGISRTGWAIFGGGWRLVRVGLIETSAPTKPLYISNSRRAAEIARAIWELVQDGTVSQAYVEAPGGAQSSRALQAMTTAYTAVTAPLEISEDVERVRLLMPKKVKQVVAGDQKASKERIQHWVQKAYPDAEEKIIKAVGSAKGRQEHIYDAIAVGMAGREMECI